MSRKAQASGPVPEETARVAPAAYPQGKVSMQMRKVWGSISADEDVADLFPKDGQPTEAPWRFALMRVLPCVENVSDQQAADAVRGRIDWKELPGLERTDAGGDASVLCEFRARVMAPCAICACWSTGSRSSDNKAG